MARTVPNKGLPGRGSDSRETKESLLSPAPHSRPDVRVLSAIPGRALTHSVTLLRKTLTSKLQPACKSHHGLLRLDSIRSIDDEQIGNISSAFLQQPPPGEQELDR